MLMYYFAGPIKIEITPEEGHQMDKMLLLAFITGVFVVGIVIAVIVALISKKAGKKPGSKDLSPGKTLIIVTAVYLLVCYSIYTLY
jgi:heme/copper-type cytochrome/quinol oxidase subunit 2